MKPFHRFLYIFLFFCAAVGLRVTIFSSSTKGLASSPVARVHTDPGQYSHFRRWLQEASSSEGEDQSEKNFTNVNGTLVVWCNFSQPFNNSVEPATALESDSNTSDITSDLANGLSLVTFPNGTFVCEIYEEIMPGWEMVLWLLLLLYLFLALYIICDHHFVPALEVVGNALRWSESVQGATLLAVGSSFPEFVTALVGVIFFPEDNPGPSTNIGSAVFNTCVVIGSSLIFLPKAKNGWKILPKPFFRDAVSFIIATTCTYIAYLVYTPKFLYWYECLMLALVYVIYVVILITTDKCISPPISEEEREFIEAATAAAIVGKRASMVTFRRFEPADRKITFRKSITWDKHDSRGHMRFAGEGTDKKARPKTWAGKLDTSSLQTLESGVIEIELGEMSSDSASPSPGALSPKANIPGLREIGTPKYETHKSHVIGSSEIVAAHPTGKKKKSCGACFYKIVAAPITYSLKITVPQPRRLGKCNGGCMTALACFMSIVWLGFVTYFVVEIAQDVFLDIGFGSEFLGLTVLAVGSSLPDCLSSIIVARQGRIDMAVANALGSNIFDFLWCIGFPIMVQALMEQKPIYADIGDSFSYLLYSCFIVGAVVLFIIPVGCMRATPWHGALLVVAYATFIGIYVWMFGIAV